MFNPADREDIENLHKSQNLVHYTLLCNKICFKNYDGEMTISES